MTPIDVAESYLVACAETTGVGVVVSFDRSIDRVASVSRVEPPAASRSGRDGGAVAIGVARSGSSPGPGRE